MTSIDPASAQSPTSENTLSPGSVTHTAPRSHADDSSTSHLADAGTVVEDGAAAQRPPTASAPTAGEDDHQQQQQSQSQSQQQLHHQEQSSSQVRGMTGPVGEPGLPPSRPSSSGTRRSSRHTAPAPPSRHGSRRNAHAGGSAAGGSSGRPPTAGSRTHAPGLTSHAFFRPMSSQRLQAQRGARPNSLLGQTGAWSDQNSDSASNLNRRSDLSNLTALDGRWAGNPGDGPPPPSRGTDYTNPDTFPDRTTANSTPTGAAETVRSRGESITPLQPSGPAPTSSSATNRHHRIDKKPGRLDLDAAIKHVSNAIPTPTKSPHSFRSSFIIPSRGSRQTSASRMPVHETGHGAHEKLGSAPSSPGALDDDEDDDDDDETHPDHDLERQKAVLKQQMKKRANLGRNWEYWAGNTLFCFGGRLQNAKDKPVNIATGAFVAVPSALFLAFSAPWIWHNISPVIPILYGYLFFVCFSSFIHASASDPGILPRNLHPFPPEPPNQDPLAIGPPTTEWTLVLSKLSASAAMEVPTKYCKSCNIWRPPRAHHCRVCDNCIETQDHHCVWLNNCIGRRNYRYFFTFVSTGTVLGLFLAGASLAHLLVWASKEDKSFGEAIDHWRVPFAVFIYALIAFPYPCALWVYHLFLTARGETTREYLNSHKFAKHDRHRPFTQGTGVAGLVRNWVAVLVRPRPPTYMRFKDRYVEGDRRLAERRGWWRKRDQEAGSGVEMSEMTGFQGPKKLADEREQLEHEQQQQQQQGQSGAVAMTTGASAKGAGDHAAAMV